MPFPDQERTEAATPRRREEARRQGQVAKSGELTAAVVLVALAAAFYLAGGGLLRTLLEAIRVNLARAGTGPGFATLASLLLQDAWLFAKAVTPFLATALAAGMAVNLLQTGFLYTPLAVAFNFARLNPRTGLRNLLSGKSLVGLALLFLKLLLLGLIVYSTIASEWDHLPSLADADLADLLTWQGRWAFTLLIRVSLAFLLLALLDYGWQRWLHEKGLRMTREEVKEELRQTEGDPRIKARIRSLQQEMARHRMMSQVPRATVVIVNPIHLAVALRYDRERMPAPVVIAKGRRLVAERIVQRAKERGIPIVEDPPLARALFYGVQVGEAIPVALYRAVAEVLAYVYLVGQQETKAGTTLGEADAVA